MAAESIIDMKRPGFPRESSSSDRDGVRIEYIGDKTTIEAARPSYGDLWGDYAGIVVFTELQPTEKADIAVLIVDMGAPPDLSDDTTGTAKEITYEIDWVPVSRNMLEHPQFRRGGGGANEFAEYDLTDIEFWRNEQSPVLRREFKYNKIFDGGSYEAELSTNAKLFAVGILDGIEEYDDFAPILRKTTTYIGGPSDTTDAGTKNDPGSFPGKPIGYEWLKTADRSVRAGGQKRWEKIEEWTGAIKVLVDREQVFWDPPAPPEA
jgi:hypothetical protein